MIEKIEETVTEALLSKSTESLKALYEFTECDARAVDQALCQKFGLKVLLAMVEDDSLEEEVREYAEYIVNACLESREKLTADGFSNSFDTEQNDFRPRTLEFTVTPSAAIREWWSADLEERSLAAHTFDLRLPNQKERIGSEIPSIMWPCSTVLARLLLSVPELVAGKRVLEIGAGFHAVPALAACRAECDSVMTTDLDAIAVNLMNINLGRNKPHVAQVERLDWSKLDEYDFGLFDVVIGADIIHEEPMAELVENTVRHFLKPDGVAVIVNGRSRARYGIKEFQENLNARTDLEVSIRAVPECLSAGIDMREVPAEVYKIQFKTS